MERSEVLSCRVSGGWVWRGAARHSAARSTIRITVRRWNEAWIRGRKRRGSLFAVEQGGLVV